MTLKISIIGTGYVGLVSAACYAEHGHDVTCVDIDSAKIDSVNRGESFLHEPGLQDLLKHNVPGRLRATDDLAAAVRASDLTMVAVPTPFDARSGLIDLSSVLNAAEAVGRALADKEGFHSVVLKSTCVPGTAVGAFCDAITRGGGKNFAVGSCPEFLSEGTAVDDFLNPDRIVIGGDDPRVLAMLRELHAGFADVTVLETTPSTAEAIKYASNALLATCVSFANEIANACEVAGDVDALDVMRGVSLSRYLTTDGHTAPLAAFLIPGCGYGGSCLPKDVAALAGFMRTRGVEPTMLDAVAKTNDGRGATLVARLAERLGSLKGRKIVVLGTAFKPGTGDLRTSPAEPVIDALVAAGATVQAHDPAAAEATRERFGERITMVNDARDACRSADGIIICTAWPEYQQLPQWLAGLTKQPLVADGRRAILPEAVQNYIGVGLSTAAPDPMRQAA